MAGTAICGAFDDPRRAAIALAELKAAGFARARISGVAHGEAASALREFGPIHSSLGEDRTAIDPDAPTDLRSLEISAAGGRDLAEVVARGGVLVIVPADARASEAAAVLRRYGANPAARASSAQSVAAGTNARSAQAAQPDESADDQALELRAERLAIDKVRVISGEARIRKEVISEQRSIEIPVSHEELVIERRPVAGGAAVGGGAIGTDRTIVVPLSREDVKLRKRTFVTEEVELGKRVVAETAHISETVRHEELVVAPLSAIESLIEPR